MDAYELAGSLFGTRRMEGSSSMRDYDTTIFGEAVSDSENGTVLVKLSDDVTTPDGSGDAYVELPTYVSVRSGDTVSVGVSTNGTIGDPRVRGVIGGGDRMQAQVDSAETLAQQAEAVANATGQNFWSDSDGVHVTEVTQDEWSDSTSPNYHSGANVLLNALGQLFRDGLNNLLAILTSGIAIYDGNGNDASNILAEFMADHVRVGGNVPVGDGGESAIQFFDQTETHGSTMDAFVSVDENEDVPGYPFYDLQSTIGVRSTLADEGRVVDTGSKGEAALSLEQELSYGLADDDEQFTEVHAALVADATYDKEALYPTTSHARVSATATTGTTTGSASGLSYVELIADALGIGEGEGLIDYTAMRQVLVGLRHPSATYTANVGTWSTGTANSWETAGYGVTVAESGGFANYLDTANKGNGEFTALVGCTVRVSSCVTWVDSVSGRRSVGAFVNATRSGTQLSGGTEYSNSGLFYTGSNAKTAQLSPLVLHLSAGNRLNFGKYAPANAIQSNQTYKMNWVTIEVLAVD